ncbi:hypothetical protein [Pseudonocardia acaciae]|uniref:hypothetical protein n=1 Tax=Pseudonocardia acaciae TaxID=551276 RepID=UPI0012ECE37D|nr:hypothetical protein [Pseudonocardia acaciae]
MTAVLLTALASGCGGPPSAPSAPPPLPRYATVAELGNAVGIQAKQDKTVKLSIVGTVSGGASPQPATNEEQQVRYDAGGISVQLSRKLQEPGSPVPMESTILVLPDQAYVKPPEGIGMPLGKSWIKVPTASEEPWLQQLILQVQALRETADPTKTFTQLGSAAGITESVEEPVNGVRSVRYKIRIDMVKAAEQQTDPAIKAQLQSQPPSVDATLWLDEHNRMLRQVAQRPGEDATSIVTIDARYRDWGLPVDINPPPPDQVIDA